MPPIDSLPDEILLLALGNLSPLQLGISSLVCKRWFMLVHNDSCWRSALIAFMGVLPERRIASTWKKEYLRRFQLYREFASGGKKTIQVDLQFEPLTIFLDSVLDRIYAASLDGILKVCNASTGKIEREVFLNNQNEVSPVSSILVEANRIFVGNFDGRLGIVTQLTSKYSFKYFDGFHQSKIVAISSCVNFQNVVLTACSDGVIKGWHVPTLQSTLVTCITKIVFDSKKFIYAATNYGNVLLWEIDLNSISIGSTSSSRLSQAARVCEFSNRFPKVFQIFNSRITDFYYDTVSHMLLVATDSLLPDSLAFVTHLGRSGQKFETSKKCGKLNCVIWDKPLCTTSSSQSSIFTGHDDGTVNMFVLNSSTTLYQPLRGIKLDACVTKLLYDPFKLCICTEDGIIHICDSTTLTQLKSVRIHRNEPIHETFAGEWKVVGCADTSMKIWDFQSQFLKRTKKTQKVKKKAVRTLFGNSELKDVVKEAKLERKLEREQEQKALKKSGVSSPSSPFVVGSKLWSEKKSPSTLDGLKSPNNLSSLTEQELIAYATMLSLEEQNFRLDDCNSPTNSSFSNLTPLSPTNVESQETFRRNAWYEDDDWDEEFAENTYTSEMRRASLTVPISPVPFAITIPKRQSWNSNRRNSIESPLSKSQLSGTPLSYKHKQGSSWSHIASGGSSLGGRTNVTSPRTIPVSPTSKFASPKVGPTGVGVQVVKRSEIEDDELMYVLELSMHDQ